MGLRTRADDRGCYGRLMQKPSDRKDSGFEPQLLCVIFKLLDL